MSPRFGCFVIFAGMRTGSNHLEESLNQLPGLTCHGELFNPHFVGHQNRDTLFGMTRAARDADPLALFDRMRADSADLPGFRFFHDHDPRVLDRVLPDPTVAKIVLTRDPLESYVSLRIARQTQQWRVTDPADRRSARIRFVAADYAEHAARQEAFHARIRRALQVTGQAAFDLAYPDINDIAVLNGIVRFLGLPDRLYAPSPVLQRQNPEPVAAKVTNPEEMAAALAAMGRGAGAAEPVAGDLADLLARARVTEDPPRLWLCLPGVAEPAPPPDDPLTRETLRQWLNRTKRREVLATVAHPARRAWRLFEAAGADPGGDASVRRDALLDFLADPAASGPPQVALLACLAAEVVPDRLLREGEPGAPQRDGGVPPDIWSDEVEAALRHRFTPDYRVFGFRKGRGA